MVERRSFSKPLEHPAPRRSFPLPTLHELDVPSLVDSWAHRMYYSVGKDEFTATSWDVYKALALSIRDRLMERWFKTQSDYYENDVKRVYYLSLEFLMGRSLLNNILNLGAYTKYSLALEQVGYRLEHLEEYERDAGLGNGGLGRLAACFLESAATIGLPFYGYGIRYEYGIFNQKIVDGQQFEMPDNWLRYGNPWEVARNDALFPVKFFGRIEHYKDEDGLDRVRWVDTQDVYAMAFDTPILGYKNEVVNSLRLWAAKSSREFDLSKFNAGDYVRAVEDKNGTENISKVLYPPDDQYAGKELRLKQQYFFSSATLQDVIRRFLKKKGRKWDELPDKVAIQLNDTHPAVAIPELMRVLVDDHRLDWSYAWDLTQSVFGYTNHTVLEEALESWPMEFFARLLPRHQQIIVEIDRRLRASVKERFPDDEARIERMSILDEKNQRLKMANLAITGSHAVNGVAKLHTEILKHTTFRDFEELFPGRITNKTNGVTPRRWLFKANPGLSALITESIGTGWIADLEQLTELEKFVEDISFRERWREVKRANKVALAHWYKRAHGFDFDPDSLFDVQVKRIHEYKRQLLNVLHVIALYQRIRDGWEPRAPRTVMIGGKSAPSYVVAKRIIHLVNVVGKVIADDPKVSKHLKLFFLPNYGVSCAEKIFPACELSEQISTAGLEASGTGNMKAALNGALTIGTMDGANVEMCDAVGIENMFIFGHTAPEIVDLRNRGARPEEFIVANPELESVIREIETGAIEKANPGTFLPIAQMLRGGDNYFHCADFSLYVACQERASDQYLDVENWTRMSIRNVARMGRFSSDRTVRQYADEIWRVKPLKFRRGE
ncbi:MAG: glycogen/starch/alpha-glucan phosphorylase [Thermoanaerobaculia bacterium]|nr:glycogen/starch/alpha-glucan phosphorylase [Thermoanaerobaculia bacterium]